MRAQDIDQHFATELREIVRAYDGVDRTGLVTPDVVCLGLVLKQVVDPELALQSPLHVRNKPDEREPLLSGIAHQLLEERKGVALHESSVAQMCFRPGALLEASG